MRGEKLSGREPEYSALRLFNVFIMRARFWRSAGPPSKRLLLLLSLSLSLSPRRSSLCPVHARTFVRFFKTEDGPFLPRLGQRRKICLCCARASKVPGLFSGFKRPGVRVECRWLVIIATDGAITCPTAWAYQYRSIRDSKRSPYKCCWEQSYIHTHNFIEMCVNI